MAYINCAECYHRNVCAYRHQYHDMIVACKHWQPKADVVEVKHGEWVTQNHSHTCSLCDWYYYGSNKMSYCPHCGAKMGGTVDEQVTGK